MHDSEVVEKFYNNQFISEWERMELHPIEFEMTKRIIAKFINKKAAKIFDIGGGPGRYSMWLSKQGHDITLFDLSEENIEYAKIKAKEENIHISEYITGNVLSLNKHKGIQRNQYDYVLLMGPLYHLTEESDRIVAMQNALNCLKKNGLIFVTFISRYAPLIDTLKNAPEKMKDNINLYLNIFKSGINKIDRENVGFTNAYYIDPEAVRPFMNKFKIEEKGFYTVESILGPYENILKKLDKKTFGICLDLGMHFIEDNNCRANGEHLLFIGEKK